MTRLRKRVAERLLEAKNSTAMLTTFNEVNMKPIMDLRSSTVTRLKTSRYPSGFMSFYVKAVVEALKRYPEVNASIDGDDVVSTTTSTSAWRFLPHAAWSPRFCVMWTPWYG